MYHNAPGSNATRGTVGSFATYPLTCVGTAVPTPGYGSTPAPNSTIDVGSAVINQTTSTPLTISETGNATLQVTSHALSGTNAADFAVTPATLTIADGGASQDLTITCTPSAPSTRTATLTVNHNASGNPATYTLTCEGTTVATPGYGSTPAPGSTINLGNSVVNTATSTSLTIRETGSATLQVSDVTLTGTNASNFSATPTNFSITNGGAAQDITVTCTPSAEGTRTATLTVYHNAPGSNATRGIVGSFATYPLTCVGTAVPTPGYDSTPAAGGTLNVGSAAVGTLVTTPLVIREVGSATLQVNSTSLSGANASDFSVIPATLIIADGGAAQSLIVRCTPSAPGARTAMLSVYHNASGSPATYTLTCTGTAAQFKLYLIMVQNG